MIRSWLNLLFHMIDEKGNCDFHCDTHGVVTIPVMECDAFKFQAFRTAA